jgi:hypothetical protein
MRFGGELKLVTTYNSRKFAGLNKPLLAPVGPGMRFHVLRNRKFSKSS